ncbi:MAG: cyclase [Bacteroidota bacterium]|jgi:hypothetical protein|nr:cyclase [Bacteroidota bacterium]
MLTVILTHEVKDYEPWRKVYEAGEPLRTASGIKMDAVYTSVDNPNKVTMIGEIASMEAMQSFMQNPQLAADMQAAGVISKPEVTILQKK